MRMNIVKLCILSLVAWGSAVSAQTERLSPNDPGFVHPDRFTSSPPAIIDFGAGPALATASDTCRCLDLVLVIDDTGSMGPAIENVKAEIVDILALADSICGSVQAGLVSFKDDIEVDVPMTFNLASVASGVQSLVAAGGLAEPEASDEALYEVLSMEGASCEVTGDFDPSTFRDECCRVVILITDARPGGCDDDYTVADSLNADAVTVPAQALGVKIAAIYPETFPTRTPTIVPVMQNYASKTGGVYGQVSGNGAGTGNAIEQIVLDCIGSAATELCCTSLGCVEVLQGTCVENGGYLVSDCSACAIAVKNKSWGAIKELYRTSD